MKTETRERTESKGVMCAIHIHGTCPGSRYNEDMDWECTCECHYGPFEFTCARCGKPVEWKRTEAGGLLPFKAGTDKPCCPTY